MTHSLDDRMPAFLVRTADGKQNVVDASGRNLMVCADAHSAGHYATLMNQAFEAGYKTGYRDAVRVAD